MRFPKVLAALLALCPLGAFAQGTDFKGLDLTDEPKKEEPKKEEDAPPPPTTLEPTSPGPATTAPAPKAEQKLDEVQIANEDRVKSVERKAFLKKMRFEIAPMGFVTVNDAFYPKSGPGGRLAFWFADSVALAFRYNQYNILNNDNVRLAKRELQSKLPYVHPKHGFNVELIWSPVYGKIAVVNSINTFDAYVVGGAGAFLTQTESIGGPQFSAHVGVGEKFHVLDWLAIDFSVIDTLYADRPGGATKSVLQNLVSLNLGVSVYLPLGFDYKEP